MSYPIRMSDRERSSNQAPSQCISTFIPLDEMAKIFAAYPKQRKEDKLDPGIIHIPRKKTGPVMDARISLLDGTKKKITRDWFCDMLDKGLGMEQLMNRLECKKNRIEYLISQFDIDTKQYPGLRKRVSKNR
ncbi:hypothetical protein [Paenibacillus sp. P22]|uniref:hypothetical protein n=1 Tax=Paenibacillus sp. P22 TaxID=483908 RepID=UPI00038FDB5E|nr:hypothetical protein [Paenibacillus sp. P22]CDN44012.1 hypothetical protein BN871_EA_00070 [Paenibacillus sp. P22]